jgi:ABC-type polysaccharide/polyol phosphate transport system ATPase subunit
MPPIIEIQKLGKKYSMREVQPYLALRDVVAEKIKNGFRKGLKSSNQFWALQDINLRIEKGERVGIIGRNGAGKSTLLKILSKITPPTTGEIKLRGRVASLLEVGTGFHPELTGRENIYLNGSILGLTKKEINQKLEEIIGFSGVEKFIDTPLKHYSSGMQLRLAFSVAAHLNPEILLIDEVLAMGDMEFQRKCIGKMEEVSRQDGRTILFVSHNMKYISSFCTKGICLDQGKKIFEGAIDKTISSYSQYVGHGTGNLRINHTDFIFRDVSNKDDLHGLKVSDNLEVHLSFSTKNFRSQNVFFDIGIYNINGEMVIHSRTRHNGQPFSIKDHCKFEICYKVKSPNLAPGNYFFTLFVYEEKLEQNILLWIDDCPLCSVDAVNPYANEPGVGTLHDIKSATYPLSSFEIL